MYSTNTSSPNAPLPPIFFPVPSFLIHEFHIFMPRKNKPVDNHRSLNNVVGNRPCALFLRSLILTGSEMVESIMTTQGPVHVDIIKPGEMYDMLDGASST